MLFFMLLELCKTEIGRRNCNSCKMLLTSGGDINMPPSAEDAAVICFFHDIMCGLIHPSELIFNLAVKLWELFTLLEKKQEVFSKLVSFFVYGEIIDHKIT